MDNGQHSNNVNANIKLIGISAISLQNSWYNYTPIMVPVRKTTIIIGL